VVLDGNGVVTLTTHGPVSATGNGNAHADGDETPTDRRSGPRREAVKD
jgi:hypothetical protein